MKRIIIAVLVILLIVAGVFVFSEYQKIKAVQNLQISVDQISIDELKLSGAKIGFVVVFHNPNEIEVTTGEINAGVFANGVHVADVRFEPMLLAPGETLEKRSQISINYLDVSSALLQAFKEGDVVWKVKGEYTLLLPFGFEYKSVFEL